MSAEPAPVKPHRHIAALWIRDGVLVERMHINPVAYAFATLLCADPELLCKTSLEELINFGFAKSGISCADKMHLYNQECLPILKDVDAAAHYYNILANEAASHVTYFAGAPELLRDLKLAGVQNFITSAVEQSVLDAWQATAQGQEIAPHLQEILGKRENFAKGREHFAYVSKSHANSKIYYIADAVSEIQTGRESAQEFGITPVGFGNVINKAKVGQAVDLVLKSLRQTSLNSLVRDLDLGSIQLNPDKLNLPSSNELSTALSVAGAAAVITGTPDTIMHNLRQFFIKEGVLPLAP